MMESRRAGVHPIKILTCLLAVHFILTLAACQAQTTLTPGIPDGSLPASPTWSAAPTRGGSQTQAGARLQTPALVKTTSPSPALIHPASPTPKPVFYEPAGCWHPPDDYSRVHIDHHTLNTRTYAMLQQAARLYHGEIDVAGRAILQGSYLEIAPGIADSHLGGGAVDISVSRPGSDAVLYTEIEPLIQVLRTVGFAAWLRQGSEPEQALGFHIHAVAIGDKELSPGAHAQITGPDGYLRGFDGLTHAGSDPVLDTYGAPLICRWMLEAGYADLRTPTPNPTQNQPWQERLRQAALAYQAFYPEDAEQVARDLNFLDGQSESAENICGPLSAAILRDSGLLPNQPGPVQELKSYWQARPSDNGRPWSLFPERDYEVFRFTTPLAQFDFGAWPLQPADFVYTYASKRGFEHMFVVTEVDAAGRAYTVTNQYQIWGNEIWGNMLIQRYLLYDPQTPGAGIIYHDWSDNRLGQTGNIGFDVMRKRGLQAGSLYKYSVRPGDTLPLLAARFGSDMESIAQANPGLDQANLQVDQLLAIPIPVYLPNPPEAVQGEIP